MRIVSGDIEREQGETHSGGLLFGEMTILSEEAIELTTVSILEDQEDTLIVVEPTEETEDVGVP